jgi:hypothetical protein
MRWICLEFANLDLEDEQKLKGWLEDATLYYGKDLNEWVWSYVEQCLVNETKKETKIELTSEAIYELNGLNPMMRSEKELCSNWIFENRIYLSHIQKDLRLFLKDLKDGNDFITELNEQFPSNVNDFNMIGLHHETQINEKFQKIRFGIALEIGDSSVRRVVQPIIENYEVMIYADLLKYINNGLDVIFCSRCDQLIINPKTGQIRNYRRGIQSYCDDCKVLHLREKNKKIKQNSRRKNNNDKPMEK